MLQFHQLGTLVNISVDSDYLLTRVLTHECLLFDTFWHSSAFKFDWSLINDTQASGVLNS